jgi:hypothetical protein
MIVVHASSRSYRATPLAEGLQLTPEAGDPRLIPWEDIVAIPARWVVTAGAALHSVHASRQAADDRAADLSACGVQTAVYGVPEGWQG